MSADNQTDMRSQLSTKKILFLFVLTLYCLLIGYKLMRLGIHGDGVEYASVARNLSDGVGTFWKPYLDDRIHSVFHEHPPLVFWIQSLFFKVFGDGPYLEAFYGFFIGIVILGCMAWFWQGVRRDFRLPAVGNWWPMLLLVPLPMFTYILQTNRIVNTWTVFAITASYMSYRGTLANNHHLFYSLLSGGLIYLGFLAKGPVAFFTFAVPVLAWLTLKAKLSKAIAGTLLALVTFALLFLGTLYLFEDSVEFWQGFWQNQVTASLTGERSPGHSRWYLPERWLSEMIVPFLITGVLMLAARLSFRRIQFNRQALFFLLVALAASLPFMISTRQHARYILHSYPFFVLSLAFATQNIAAQIESILTDKRIILRCTGAAAVLFFVIALSSMLYFKDHDAKRRPFYQDFYLANIELPQRITISVCPADVIYHDWLFADMQRYYKISLTPEMGHPYLIIAKNNNCTVPEGYQRVNQEPTIKYLLYKKNRP
jgi:4-amino-4-deoxy-L-arabinose transferase-like glycosyltransferase